MRQRSYDVAILGGGLAGLSLARQLLLETDNSVLLVERRSELPPKRQKVGESQVQLAGHYFSKVLDLEEHLLREHFMKYNLRFYWKSAGLKNDGFEHYSQSYIRNFSNIASYQVDRNKLEAELLSRNLGSRRFELVLGARVTDIHLAAGDANHRITLQTARGTAPVSIEARWVVDTTGRGRLLARQLDLGRKSPIRHGSFFWWVEGLVDIEKLTGRSRREVRIDRRRGRTGHLPSWLATNHFVDEGLWFWVIPLQGKTSLGLVYDHEVMGHREVFSVEKATRWVCEHFPLFARDLPHRKVLDCGGLRSYAHDCAQTLSADRWAMAGESGRFHDPLYSPGSDLIAVHNTLIVDAIEARASELPSRCAQHEQLLKALYSAYLPTYAESYDTLGDQETFSLKYVWELTIYFGTYVFPFINELFVDRRFTLSFLRQFARLGAANRGVQRLLSDYFRWKRENRGPSPAPQDFDFTSFGPLRKAESAFYRVGPSLEEAREELGEQIENALELARFVCAYVVASVHDDRRALTDRRFLESIDLEQLDGLGSLSRRFAELGAEESVPYEWSFDPFVLEHLRGARLESLQPGPGEAAGAAPADPVGEWPPSLRATPRVKGELSHG